MSTSGSGMRVGGGPTALALVCALAGCRVGTDLPGAQPTTLEAAEAGLVTAELLDVTLANSVFSANHVAFTHSHGVEAPHTHPVQGPYVHELEISDGPLPSHHNLFEFDLTIESPCSLGGSVLVEAAITGEGNPAVQPGSVHYMMVQTHQGCSVAFGDAEYVLSASPYLEVEAHAVNDGTGTVTVYGSLVGSIGWQAEAKGGTCALDLAYTTSAASLDEITEVSVTGTFCDLAIETPVAVD